MSLSSFLPAPHFTHTSPAPSASSQPSLDPVKSITKAIPPYGYRQSFFPRALEDYGDGGAFPEIHYPQFPLDMGRKRNHAGNVTATNVASALTSSGTLTLQTDKDGKVKYDMIVKQHARDGQLIQSQFEDIVPIKLDEWSRPGEEEEKKTLEKTVAALEKIVDSKIKAAQPKTVVQRNEAPEFIRYTPQTSDKTRIIRMVEAPIDPLEPPRFKFKKLPPSAPEQPAPILHSPSKRVTAEEQKNWVIPPCISNWKNAKGYTIPLDKRLAADGRGIQQVTINDKFASLSEAMYIAEGYAREQVRLRNEMQSKVASKLKKEKEEMLRRKAQIAREQRAGFKPEQQQQQEEESEAESSDEEGTVTREMSKEEADKVKERNEVRRERERQRIRELRMSHMGAETKLKVMAKGGTLNSERDISEKIALGLAKPNVTIQKDSVFDQRLFNQSSGLGSGFADDEAYNLYDKPLFNGSAANAVYRPKKSGEESAVQGVDADRINSLLEDGAVKGFKGASETRRGDGPVMFEKDEDVFGLDQFLSEAKKGKARDDRNEETGKRRRLDD